MRIHPNPSEAFQIREDPSKSVRFLPSPCKSDRIRPKASEALQILQNPAKSVGILPDPSEAFQVRENPSESVRLLPSPCKSDRVRPNPQNPSKSVNVCQNPATSARILPDPSESSQTRVGRICGKSGRDCGCGHGRSREEPDAAGPARAAVKTVPFSRGRPRISRRERARTKRRHSAARWERAHQGFRRTLKDSGGFGRMDLF